MSTTRTSLLIALIVAVAAALRLYALGMPLWYDELATLVQSVRMPITDIVSSFVSNNDHPLYSLLAAAFIGVFGESPGIMRLPAALAGIATVPILYLLARRVASRAEAVAATALLALSYHHIWYSQSARGYTLLLLLALLGTLLLYRALTEATPDPRKYVGYALTLALAAYTHLTMALFGVGQALAVLAWLVLSGAPWKHYEWPAIAFVLSGVLTVVFYAPMLGDVIAFFVGDAVADAPSVNAQVASTERAAMDAVRELAKAFGGLGVVAVLAVLGLVGTLSYLRQSVLLTGLFLLPIPVILAATVLLGRPIFPRFFFFAAGFCLLICVRGCLVLGKVIQSRFAPGLKPQTFLFGVTGALLLGSLTALPALYGVPKQDYGRAAAFVEGLEGDLPVYTSGNTTELPFVDYLGKDWNRLWSDEEFRAALEKEETLILTTAFERYVVAGRPALWASIQERCALLERFPASVAGAEIGVYECRSAGGTS